MCFIEIYEKVAEALSKLKNTPEKLSEEERRLLAIQLDDPCCREFGNIENLRGYIAQNLQTVKID